jgi:hypothetical protein
MSKGVNVTCPESDSIVLEGCIYLMSLVGVSTGCRLDGRISIPDRGASASRQAILSTQPPIQWISGAKRSWREADRSPPSSVEVKNGEAVPPLPNMPSWRRVSIIKQRDKFIFLPLYLVDYFHIEKSVPWNEVLLKKYLSVYFHAWSFRGMTCIQTITDFKRFPNFLSSQLQFSAIWFYLTWSLYSAFWNNCTRQCRGYRIWWFGRVWAVDGKIGSNWLASEISILKPNDFFRVIPEVACVYILGKSPAQTADHCDCWYQ